ncbi:hypothetical protein [Anthocerotibacter panamensis]|uniref:hypothetical protein n=1 Tax=Anthocerotibacter panamensis TaxID=2857077 RepID=UPI001C402425|nr:hypothetical protein [Anthocerotibacter panamensis]
MASHWFDQEDLHIPVDVIPGGVTPGGVTPGKDYYVMYRGYKFLVLLNDYNLFDRIHHNPTLKCLLAVSPSATAQGFVRKGQYTASDYRP